MTPASRDASRRPSSPPRPTLADPERCPGVFRPFYHRISAERFLVYRLDGPAAVALGWGGRYVVFAACGAPCWPNRSGSDIADLQHCPTCWSAAGTNDTAAGARPPLRHADTGAEPSARVTGELRAPAMIPAASAVATAPHRPSPRPGALPLGHRRGVTRQFSLSPHRTGTFTMTIPAPDARCITTPRTAPDQQLVAAARSGSNDAFAELFSRHHQAMLRYARSRFPHVAEDAVAAAFLATYLAIRSGRGPTDDFRAYVTAVVRNTASSFAADAQRAVPVENAGDLITDVSSPLDELVLVRLDHVRLAIAYRHLPQRWRTVLKLTALDRLPREEVAALLDLEPNTLSVLARRARNGLRAQYEAIAENVPDVARHLRTCGDCEHAAA
ncbi:sigma-70 family RNA polymerase sigma factor [Saccharothrix sp. AJ9571]|nr:sigma-70 family RNA polymerase sigma factor [Saccharothrix sp. AJ9571]